VTRAAVCMLDERRLHMQDGPIDLIVEARGTSGSIQAAYAAAATRFSTVLDELCSELSLIRSEVAKHRPPEGHIAHRMWSAVLPFTLRCFITPMAAVAGSVADEILEAMAAAAGITSASVNNGGDIALRLTGKETVRIGLVDRPDRPSLFASATLSAADSVGGIATSGWRGRSFSLGIADAVTVLARDAAMADAAATFIANAVDLPGHPGVHRVPAASLQPESDLRDMLVTRGVGPLSPDDVIRALDAGVAAAETMIATGLIVSAALHLAGTTRTTGNAVSSAHLAAVKGPAIAINRRLSP